MSTLKSLEDNYRAIENLIVLESTSLDVFLSLRLRGRIYIDLIDNHMPGMFARLLTTDIIETAFENGKAYLVKQAYWALGWYQKSQEVTETNELTTAGHQRGAAGGDKGQPVKRMKPNAELFTTVPDIANFPILDFFVKNRWRGNTKGWQEIDEFFIEQGFIDSLDSSKQRCFVAFRQER